MYLGIDLGTSSVKALLVGDDERVVADASVSLVVQRPRPGWSEQEPETWWQAVLAAVDAIRVRAPRELSATRAIGLSGQMHAAVLLDSRDRPLRPAILWNDGRSADACQLLRERVHELEEITGNLAMPGFTAPKLVWVAEHEPEIFAAVAKVLLPKDYVRLRLAGDYASDVSDASGTLWLDVAEREWSGPMLEATGLSESAMPRLYESAEATSSLRAELRERWKMGGPVAVAAGAGDNAATAMGLGVTRPDEAFVSLGTSGVTFVVRDGYSSAPLSGVHTFCHAVPGAFHQMSVVLSAASCIGWLASTLGVTQSDVMRDLEASEDLPSPTLFLPYLSGERTPHNDPAARGVFFGLSHASTRAELTRAVFEGVSFAIADGQRALLDAGATLADVSLIGGGARSAAWARILASVLGRPLHGRARPDLGAAFGAARLARMSVTGETADVACPAPPIERTIEPDAALVQAYAPRLAKFRRLYAALRDEFATEEESRRAP